MKVDTKSALRWIPVQEKPICKGFVRSMLYAGTFLRLLCRIRWEYLSQSHELTVVLTER